MKKIIKSIACALAASAMLLSFAACSSSETTNSGGASTNMAKVGVIQYATHGSLDNCYQGFKEGLAEIAVAVLACSWSYKLIGEYVASVPNSKDNEFYRPWIDTYTSEEYIKENDMTIDLVNSLTENYTEEQLENLEKIIVNCSRYEYMFWDMAWNKEM